MATILQFPCEGRVRNDVRPGGDRLGEIIIFPGVRIERCGVEEMRTDHRSWRKSGRSAVARKKRKL